MGSDERGGAGDAPIVGPPRWVKVLAVIGVIILAAIAVMLLSGHHGPGRHV